MTTNPSNSELPFTYAPLPRGSDPDGPAQPKSRHSPLKIGLIMFSGIMLCALLLAVRTPYHTRLRLPRPRSVDPVVDMSLRPAPENLAGIETMPGSDELLFKVTRGKTQGVSEKANGVLMRGLRQPIYDWTDHQLNWQRTGFHFQPDKNWMNDPNGPLYYNGWYHFFYQYNPGGAVWGNIVWGHAVSKDLIKWTHLPLAMVADRWFDFNGVWTGSATILPDGQIIMLYTGSTNESVQVQNLAYPADLSDPYLREWVKYPGNPVLTPPPGIDIKDFRDPTTAWITPEGKWRITIGSKINRTGVSLVYDTTDFKHFELKDTILHAVHGTGMWECVDFYPVSVTESDGLDTSVNGPLVKHVLKTSLDDEKNDYYALGTYNEDNGTWIPDDPTQDAGIGLRYDYGEFYASKTFFDQDKKRRILWGWIMEDDSEAADVKKGWASVQAVPRTVLYDQKTGSNLLQWPVQELESLRQNSKDFGEVQVPAGSVKPLKVSDANELDIVAEFKINPEELKKLPVSQDDYSCPASKGATERGAIGPFGLLVLASDDLSEHTPVYFYVVKTSYISFRTFFCTDLTRSSLAPDVLKDIYGSTVPVLDGEKFSIRILVDHSIVEAYAQEGRTVITSRVYPTKAIYEDAKLYLFNNATNVSVTASVKTWQMTTTTSAAYNICCSIWFQLLLLFLSISSNLDLSTLLWSAR